MRVLHVAISTAILFVATSSHALGPIDLDVPANLAAIERDHPDHFAKIQRILAEVRRQPDGSFVTWMRTEFQARNIRETDLYKTSNPPKKRLEFTLGETAYVKVITVGGYSGL